MAVALGFPSVRHLLQELTAPELLELEAFYTIEPFGEWRADLRSAIAASAIVNSWGAKTKPSDFMPDFEATVEAKRTPEQLRDMMRTMTMIMGGTVK